MEINWIGLFGSLVIAIGSGSMLVWLWRLKKQGKTLAIVDIAEVKKKGKV